MEAGTYCGKGNSWLTAWNQRTVKPLAECQASCANDETCLGIVVGAPTGVGNNCVKCTSLQRGSAAWTTFYLKQAFRYHCECVGPLKENNPVRQPPQAALRYYDWIPERLIGFVSTLLLAVNECCCRSEKLNGKLNSCVARGNLIKRFTRLTSSSGNDFDSQTWPRNQAPGNLMHTSLRRRKRKPVLASFPFVLSTFRDAI